MKEVKVSLGERSYPIYVGYDILPNIGRVLNKAGLSGTGVIITDKNVRSYWADILQKNLGKKLPVYALDPGEESKSIETVNDIYTKLLKWGLDRYSYIIALGGGVVGDLAGFVAATYMRGIPYIQVPTTLMAQTDSSIGGKTAVNLKEGKNLAGCFYQPKLVFTDIRTLSTLPKKELKAGLAEVIKYGVIKDESIFDILEKAGETLYSIDKKIWEPIIIKCSKIKADVVARDERETKGLRAILNYGHTVGHAREAQAGYGTITHGEAVAFGMTVAAVLSHKLGYLSRKDSERQNNLIKRFFPDLTAVSKSKSIIKRLKYDKKIKSGRLRFILAKKIGKVFVTDKVTEKDITAALKTRMYADKNAEVS